MITDEPAFTDFAVKPRQRQGLQQCHSSFTHLIQSKTTAIADISLVSKREKIPENTRILAVKDTSRYPDNEILLVAGSIPVRGTIWL